MFHPTRISSRRLAASNAISGAIVVPAYRRIANASHGVLQRSSRSGYGAHQALAALAESGFWWPQAASWIARAWTSVRKPAFRQNARHGWRILETGRDWKCFKCWAFVGVNASGKHHGAIGKASLGRRSVCQRLRCPAGRRRCQQFAAAFASASTTLFFARLATGSVQRQCRLSRPTGPRWRRCEDNDQ